MKLSLSVPKGTSDQLLTLEAESEQEQTDLAVIVKRFDYSKDPFTAKTAKLVTFDATNLFAQCVLKTVK